MQGRGLHAEAPASPHVARELAVPLLRLLAQLSELLGIVQNMGESFLALARVQGLGGRPVELVSESRFFFFPLSPALSSRLAGLVERVRESFLLPGRGLAP